MLEIELPAMPLPAAMLAHQAVQPPLDTAGEPEVRRVDGQHQGGVHHARIEPVRQDQLDAQRRAAGVGQFLPLVDPREAVQPPSRGFADGRGHRRGLQPVERSLQALVVAQRRAAPDVAQDLVGAHLHQPRGRDARIAGFHDLAGGPDQDVGIPDRGDTVLLRTLHADGDATGPEVDRRHVARQRAEQVELFALLHWSLPQGQRWAGHGDGHRRARNQRPSR